MNRPLGVLVTISLAELLVWTMVVADELVFYSLKERWSKGGATLELSTVKLAKLLYCALYRCQVFGDLCPLICHVHRIGSFSSLPEF